MEDSILKLASFEAEVVMVEQRRKDDERLGYIVKLRYYAHNEAQTVSLFFDDRPYGVEVDAKVNVCLELR